MRSCSCHHAQRLLWPSWAKGTLFKVLHFTHVASPLLAWTPQAGRQALLRASQLCPSLLGTLPPGTPAPWWAPPHLALHGSAQMALLAQILRWQQAVLTTSSLGPAGLTLASRTSPVYGGARTPARNIKRESERQGEWSSLIFSCKDVKEQIKRTN